MKIAIQVADLDSSRIDGTRVYIQNLLKHFGHISSADAFWLYHKSEFNPELAPPIFPNYHIVQKSWPFFWTQIRFAFEIWQDRPDILWMPIQALPIFRRKSLKTAITIHDLAFKYFPKDFERKDFYKIDSFSDYAIRHSDKIIAISQSTKKDILKFYPEIKAEKIRVIYHGFDKEIFAKDRNLEEERELKDKLKIKGDYILYAGAIQPRKNLEILIEAFNSLKNNGHTDLQLVLAGEKAWLSEKIIQKAQKNPFLSDIKLLGKVKFGDLGVLFRGASVFAFPSLYEGFGLPILEAFASQIPVVCAKNSSLPEVAGDAALYFENNNPEDLAQKMQEVLENPELKNSLVLKGSIQLQKFSWEKCAKETLEFLKS
ncbi:glycosyltransferase family 4 protein [Patescibacteria group bacterium]|nr:glycosyltransferase family 4 protein [Patescibacteria group bacterium]